MNTLCRLLATSSGDTTVRLWKTADFTLLTELTEPSQRWVWDIAFSADSQYVITGTSLRDLRSCVYLSDREKVPRVSTITQIVGVFSKQEAVLKATAVRSPEQQSPCCCLVEVLGGGGGQSPRGDKVRGRGETKCDRDTWPCLYRTTTRCLP